MRRRLGRLTGDDWRVLAESLVLAVALEAALRLLPFSRLVRPLSRRALSPRAGTDACPSVSETDIARLVRFSMAAYRCLPLPSTCLRVSLVLCAMLRRRGWPADLRIGVRKNSDQLDAHAWVEHAGRVIGSVADHRYACLPLERFSVS